MQSNKQNKLTMKPKISFLASIPLAVATVLLVGCAGPDGPLDSDVKKSAGLVAPKNKASVLIYWASADKPSATMPRQCYLYANDKKFSETLERGSFYAHEAEPGQLRLASGLPTSTIVGGTIAMSLICLPVAAINAPLALQHKKQDRLTLRAIPGATYFVKFTPARDEKMTLVQPEFAERELADCHWLNPPGKDD